MQAQVKQERQLATDALSQEVAHALECQQQQQQAQMSCKLEQMRNHYETQNELELKVSRCNRA